MWLLLIFMFIFLFLLYWVIRWAIDDSESTKRLIELENKLNAVLRRAEGGAAKAEAVPGQVLPGVGLREEPEPFTGEPCPACGEKVAESDKYCPSCGLLLYGEPSE